MSDFSITTDHTEYTESFVHYFRVFCVFCGTNITAEGEKV